MDKNIYLDKFVKTIDELKKDIISLKKDEPQKIILIENIEDSKIKLLESFYENCNQVCDEFSEELIDNFNLVALQSSSKPHKHK